MTLRLMPQTPTTHVDLLDEAPPQAIRALAHLLRAANPADRTAVLRNAGLDVPLASTSEAVADVLRRAAAQTIADDVPEAPKVASAPVEPLRLRAAVAAGAVALGAIAVGLTGRAFEAVPLGATTAALLAVLAVAIAASMVVKTQRAQAGQTTWLPRWVMAASLGWVMVITVVHGGLIAAAHPGALGVIAAVITAVTPLMWAMAAYGAARALCSEAPAA